MKRILIAGNVSDKLLSIPPTYPRAVRAAGAVGTVGCAEDDRDARALCEAFDALLLPGGGDIPGRRFGRPPHEAESFDDPARDLSDGLLLTAFRAAGKRILGICRGCQVGNVFLGGTLHQHLPDAYDPVLFHAGNIAGRHPAQVEAGSRLHALLGDTAIQINSSHHQAIDVPGQGLRISAVAPDGVIEAVEGDNILLVQWHPERMLGTMLPLFDWLSGA